MRIISGILKGRTINYTKNSNTRPLKDSVKENIFNVLKHSKLIKVRVEDSNILDLYSGVGSFGIEAISRKAEKVTFIEQDIKAANILRSNLDKLSVIDKSKIFNSKIENIINDKIKEKFQIIFIDPPFADNEYIKNLELIKKNKIFKRDHIVIIHREKKTNDDFKNNLKILETRNYGRSKILFALFS
jgi:16S rRNA (guanine966-N2)-methyltransferase